MTTADVAIIGGGIVGAACADALSAAKLRVALIQATDIGAGATAAGMGHIVAMDDSEGQFALTAYSVRAWQALAPELPAAVEFDRCGTVWVAADAEEMDAARAKQAYYRARGIAAELLDAQALAEAEPSLRAGLAGGLLVPDDCAIYAPAAAHWLAERARARGAWIRAGIAATGAGAKRVKLGDGSTIDAGAVLVATGSAAAAMLPWLPVRSRKGQLAITDRYRGFVRHQVVELGYLKSAHGHDNESVAFNVQKRATGQVLIGSSRQYGAEDGSLDAALMARMLRRAFEYMPGLADLSVIRTWTGMRAATPDSLPVIGEVEPGLFVAAGHEGLGITTSLGTAHLIAAALTGAAPPIPPEPYLPGRFAAA